MKPHRLLAVVVATLLLPLPSSALGVKQFNDLSRDQQAESLIKAVDKIVADVARVNPALSEAIRSYFSVAPAGKLLPPGMIGFGGSVVAVQKLALDGKLDLDKVQIEGMLLDIIKTDLMPQQVSQNTLASAPVPNGPPQSSEPSVKDQWELALGAALDQWLKYLDQDELENQQKLQEVECQVIRLHDGRPVWKGDHGWVAITEQEALAKSRECLAQHGLSNPDRTERTHEGEAR